jgi:catechol 2,3-dioxygenase-like lactoylglutathione lyase family enzyme
MYRIDHLVLTVRSIERTCQFYAEALRVEAITFGDGRRALQLGDQKINLHEAGREFEPKARLPTPGSGDFCLVTDEPLDELIARQQRLGVPIEEGPVTRTGAVGPLRSIYIRDPDGNLVEIANQM